MEKTFIDPINGKHMVMTNFSNSREPPPANLPFNGLDRYNYAMEYIDEHRNDFNLEEGLRVLLNTQQHSNWKTLISIAFDVENLNIYFSIKRRNRTIFRFNLMEGVITGLGAVRPGASIEMGNDIFDLKKLERYYSY
jgi:hypothetical protein